MGIFGLGKKKHSSLIGPVLRSLYEIIPLSGTAQLTKLLSGAPSGSEILAIYRGSDVEALKRLPAIIKKQFPGQSVIDVLPLTDGDVLIVKGDFTEEAFARLKEFIKALIKVILKTEITVLSGRYDASQLMEPPKVEDMPAKTGSTKSNTSIESENSAPGITQKAVELAEEYIKKDHPLDASMQLLGIKHTKPMYEVVSNQVGRSSHTHIDMKILSVAACLPGEDIAMNDTQKIARKAFDAIQHYASIPVVQAFFLAPYRLRAGKVTKGSDIPPEEQCRVYAGIENLLLEIYDELPLNGTITDAVVAQKINQLVKSA